MFVAFDIYNASPNQLVHINPEFVVSVQRANKPETTIIKTVVREDGENDQWWVIGNSETVARLLQLASKKP